MLTWQDLERQFHELEPSLRFARLDAQWGAAGEHWRVAGGFDTVLVKRFEAIAALAGDKLRGALNCSSVGHDDLKSETDPIRCWYKGLAELSNALKTHLMATQLDTQGKPAGNIFTGTVERPAEASAVFCLELAARFPDLAPPSVLPESRPDAPNRLSVFWEKYGAQILIAVVATVIGGLLLALLL